MSSGQPLVVIGAGGFGRETLDVIAAANEAAGESLYRLVGVVDDAPSELNLDRLARRGVTYLGSLDTWLADAAADAAYVIGVGSPTARRAVDRRLRGAPRDAVSIVHPDARIGSEARIAPGCVICAGVQISTNVTLERHVHVNPNAIIGHDAVLGDFVSVNPGGIVSGECRIGAETLIGAGAVVLQNLEVGPRVVVGAAACVTRDIHEEATVKGVPAR